MQALEKRFGQSDFNDLEGELASLSNFFNSSLSKAI